MDSLDRYLDNLSMPYYTSKHPVHGPFNPDRERVGFLNQADNEADMRHYIEESARELLFEEEAGGETMSYDGSSAVGITSEDLAELNVKTKTFAELADQYWNDIADSVWNPS